MMLRRAILLAALIVVLGVSSGVAGNVKTKTWSLDHINRPDSAVTNPIGVAGYQSFRVIIDEVVGDTLSVDSVIWIVQTRADNGNTSDHPWISAYTMAVMTADSASYPVEFSWKGDTDSLVWDQIRIKQQACGKCDTAWTDSGATADKGLATFLIRLIATKF